ncbi:MAG: radical SAM family heme chaperone HemW [Geminocystis sp.]|nr:radical SAM family heme chaperone HemW [Geminocystis sp.]HIK38088.1 coproporphyrinogen III oxidase [Geminocystis sp. M7585_C2015_104]MCS7149054.1 radical SAM family heme chaperone HemW [Geminocystis sp.]MCX8077429.1 radical SAM family heme chaperone HemW [Geminocystis sp.]MDW8117131.1 radical SAM family heme chaperone HemW [Geminocystis sp.]
MIINAAYIHIPFCRRRCFYCDFPITVLGENGANVYISLQEEYVDFLCREIRATPKKTSSLATVFFGGGTPSLLYLEGLAKVLDALSQHLGISKDAEVSIEIDPATFDLNKLKKYKSLGVNRITLGIQAFQDNLLQSIGRSHRLKDIQQAIDDIYQADFDNWGLDLISGLPYQTLDDWQQSLAKAVELQPKHISCYDLVLEPTTVFGKKYQAGKKPLPTEENTAEMYCMAVATLEAAGYHHYEISNYAKPGYECRHNQVYWLNQPYYGFGMGAASYTDNIRFTRPRTRQQYYAWVVDYERKGGILEIPPVSETDRFLETLMLGLRLKKGVNLAGLEAEYGQNFVKKLISSLRDFALEKLVILDEKEGIIRLASPLGFLYSNTILSRIFAEFLDER